MMRYNFFRCPIWKCDPYSTQRLNFFCGVVRLWILDVTLQCFTAHFPATLFAVAFRVRLNASWALEGFLILYQGPLFTCQNRYTPPLPLGIFLVVGACSTGAKSKWLNRRHGGADVRCPGSSRGYSSTDQLHDGPGRKSPHVLSCCLHRVHIHCHMVHFKTRQKWTVAQLRYPAIVGCVLDRCVGPVFGLLCGTPEGSATFSSALLSPRARGLSV